MIRELSNQEIMEVSGAGFWYDVFYAVGVAVGAGAATQESIDSIDNSMLGAMQYGA